MRRCSVTFFRCTSRHKLLFLVLLAVVIATNIAVLVFNKKEQSRRGLAARRPSGVPSAPAASSRAPPAATSTARPAAAAVLVVSYEGAGGSAVSQLLNLLPGVSHHPQPLSALDEQGAHSGTAPLPAGALSDGLRLLDDTLHCNVTRHDRLFSAEHLLRQHALRTVFLRTCVPNNVSVSACLGRVCRAAGTVSAHVIRPMVADLAPLLSRWRPRLRLLLVQRDPRAVLASRRRRGRGLPLTTADQWRHAARQLCSRMLHDVEASDREEALQPGLRKVVLFEHLLELAAVLGRAALRPPRADAWRAEVPELLARAADAGCAHFYDASMYSAVAESGDLQRDGALHGGLPGRGSDVI
ncbi:hypothetical protein FJT64_001920 [Amphibalanus amphitrite]|uniref:Carbohydrate sulfotransferase 1 n=1 Tax=Amphibalanus amphitrite TaxID=1232801 RepID=A0A6A4X428_AMPAM|nr:hypothetical protein FJT64_001920 [Amphibalanus amphitrite]